MFNFIPLKKNTVYTPFTSSYTNHQIHSHLHGNSLSNIKQYQKQRQPTAASIDFYREDFIGSQVRTLDFLLSWTNSNKLLHLFKLFYSQALEDLSTFLNHAVYSIPIR